MSPSRSLRSQRGTIAETGPALIIACAVIFFIIGFGFFFCGVVTAYFGCQLAAREGATGGSRGQMQAAARNAARKVGEGPFGAFCNLQRQGGGGFADSLTFTFFRLDGIRPVPVDFANINRDVVYQLRVESRYQITVPFLGTIPGTAASENVIDHPEALSVN